MKTALRGRRPAATAATLTAAMLALAGCGARPLSTFDAQSPIAQELDTTLVVLLWICGGVFVIVQGLVLYMGWRFKVRAPRDESEIYPDEEFPDQTHGNTRLEIAWTILPTVIMAIVAFFTLSLHFRLNTVEAQPNTRIEKITVVGQQWWWEFQYHLDDDGIPDIVTAGEMPLPVGEEVRLEITSRDVIHSFWVPVLNGKRDAVPGRITTWTMEAGSIGRFPGECTEFCGLSHAYMEKWVVGLSQHDWDTWAANQQAPAELPEIDTPEHDGWLTFKNQCSSCHVVNGLTALFEPGDPEADPAEPAVIDSVAIYDGANRVIADRQTQVSGSAPNLTHVASRSTFAGGIFELYKNPDSTNYIDLADRAVLNRGQLEAWIRNAPAEKANFWDSPTGQRGMTPFEALNAEEIDNLVSFLMTLD